MNRVPYDLELATVLQAWSLSNASITTREMIPAIRRADRLFATRARADFESKGITSVDWEIPGPGGAIAITVLRVAGNTSPHAPCVFHTHGGGLVSGTRFTGLDGLLEWMLTLGIVVISPEYRLAPESRFPAALDDCYAALRWVRDSSDELAIDSERLFLAGMSAGGGLAVLGRDVGYTRLMGVVPVPVWMRSVL